MRKILFIFLLTTINLCGLTGAAQTTDVQVSGTVSDATKNETLPGVSVKVKGTQTATVTDANGKYTLRAPQNSILVFSSVGYNEQEVKVGIGGTKNVQLNPNAQSLTDVVVVGYVKQSREKNTAAVSKLDTKQLVNTANAGPIAAIQGKIAGVSVPLSNGQPGSAGTNIIIRGGSKLNVYGTGTGNSGGDPVLSSDASSPLVIVDGVFRTMKDLNPDDIESLQVMKDAASTAIYGARGANGVIVIKTKSGKFGSGKPNITFNYRTNWETPSRMYDYLSAKDYLTLARTTAKSTYDLIDKNTLLNNGGFSAGTKVYTAKGQYGVGTNLTALYDNIVAVEGQGYVDNLLASGWQTMDDPINPGTKLLFADNNYQDLLWNTGISNNYNFGIDGGSQIATYNISMNYVDQAGTFVGTSYKRYSALGNFGFKASEKLQINAMLNYQNVLPNYVDAYTNDLVRATRITPLIRIFKDDGTPTTGENLTTRNRFHTLAYDNTKASTERLVSRVDADWAIVKGLHYRPALSYLISDDKTIFSRKAFPDPIQFATTRLKTENTNNTRQLMIDQILQYDYTLKENHHFTALAGFNYTKNDGNSIDIGSQRGTNDYITTINEPTVTTINGVTVTNVTNFGTRISQTKSASFFGQLSYDYKSKYLLSGVLRNDGFSNFAPENKWALFPSVSAGWNIHKEDFWKSNVVSTLKLRGSWGQAGSSDLDLTDTYGSYTSSVYAQNSGIQRANLSNPNLVWETTQTTDVAVEAGFFKNRVNLTVDLYDKLTKNRIDSKPLPAEAPFSTITFNNGTIQNKGIEIELQATVLKMKDFAWNANFSFAYNAQKVISLPNNGRLKNRQNGGVVIDPNTGKEIEVGGYAEGERPFGYYAWQVEKVFSTEAEAAAWGKVDQIAKAAGITVGKHAGDYKFADLNSDNIIDNRDMVFMGYKTPNKIGGFQNTFTYKSFTLRVNMDYALGFVISDGALARSLGQGRAYNEGAPAQALGNDIWQKSGDVDKLYARFSFGDADFGQKNFIRQGASTVGTGSGYASDVSTMISKGDFLALREIYLSYDLPKNIMSKIGSTGMSVFASVTNVGYLTKYKGLNPETYTGFDPGGYPRPRQFTLGASLRF
jgi:TonB-linked SusC/RagA family outer membrane protein